MNANLFRGIPVVSLLLWCCATASAAETRKSDDFSWVRGANYVPSYAGTDVVTWNEFDAETIVFLRPLEPRTDALACIDPLRQRHFYRRAVVAVVRCCVKSVSACIINAGHGECHGLELP